MASIEFIQKRIAGKEKEIDKLEKKLERIQKAAASGWENNPYYYTEYDLRSTTKDLNAAREALEKYQNDLAVAQEKASSRNVEPILDFLDGWKENVTRYYETSFDRYLEALQEYYDEDSKYCDWYNREGFRDPDKKEKIEEHRKYTRNFKSNWNWITPYVERVKGGYELDHQKLAYDLQQEADRKYDFIIERTNKIVGQITDASGLYVGDKGDLNGIIDGTRGSAKVQTIGAGGYNIQAFHFRTLIHKA